MKFIKTSKIANELFKQSDEYLFVKYNLTNRGNLLYRYINYG